ncbi:glucose 1-dehydrogenase [Pseudonocardia ailaonensis]|uniref:Glucose 1-dehydrogenase n=1 Tax=Pseudonocardia ailaonensis TaxID=367279 RepID=A0ABN2N5C6_9PSEU
MTDPSTRPGHDRLAGRYAIVVGGGSSAPGIGNGRATSLLLAREGAFVTVVDRDPSAAEETVAMIRASGGGAAAVGADATDDLGCRAAVERAAGPTGQIDVLVNNVGVIGEQAASAVDVDLAEWDATMRTNIRPYLLFPRHVIPRMSAGGAIVNVSSAAAIRGVERLQYATSKAALLGMTITMAAQHGPAGVRVNAVVPGAVWTPFVERRIEDDTVRAEQRARRRDRNMLRREGTAWDVAHAILFLVSDEARWITAQTLVVDGGETNMLTS